MFTNSLAFTTFSLLLVKVCDAFHKPFSRRHPGGLRRGHGPRGQNGGRPREISISNGYRDFTPRLSHYGLSVPPTFRSMPGTIWRMHVGSPMDGYQLNVWRTGTTPPLFQKKQKLLLCDMAWLIQRPFSNLHKTWPPQGFQSGQKKNWHDHISCNLGEGNFLRPLQHWSAYMNL